MNNNRNNNNNNNFPSPQGDYLVLYIENVINTAILLRNRSQRVNPSRDWSPRLIPSCKLYRGPVPATSPCDWSPRVWRPLYFTGILEFNYDIYRYIGRSWSIHQTARFFTWVASGIYTLEADHSFILYFHFQVRVAKIKLKNIYMYAI